MHKTLLVPTIENKISSSKNVRVKLKVFKI